MLSDDVLLDLGKQRELVQAAAELADRRPVAGPARPGPADAVGHAGSIEFQTIPYVGDDADDQGRYILRLEDEDTLHDFFAELSAEPEARGAAPHRPRGARRRWRPRRCQVDVYNGSGTSGLAGLRCRRALEAAGFVVTSTGNADATDYTATEIRYAAGDQALANTLAASIPGATTAEAEEPTSGTVDLVLGSNFNGVGTAVTAPEPTVPVEGEDARTAADTTCIN